MDKERLKLIVRNLELLVDGLKAEVYSDPSAYIDKRENFDDPPHHYTAITTRCLTMTMGTPIDRARKYMKLLRRLIKQEHLYTEEKIIEMKKQIESS